MQKRRKTRGTYVVNRFRNCVQKLYPSAGFLTPKKRKRDGLWQVLGSKTTRKQDDLWQVLGSKTKKLFIKLGLRSSFPATLVSGLKKHCDRIENHQSGKEILSTEQLENSNAKVTWILGAMKYMLYGDLDNEPKDENRKRLTSLLHETGLLLKIIVRLRTFDFEGKKNGAAVVNHLVRRIERNGMKKWFIENLVDIWNSLVAGWSDRESALQSGKVLQEIIKHEVLVKILLMKTGGRSGIFQVMDYCDRQNFDIMSDALTSLKLLTTRHKSVVAKWLKENYDSFFEKLNSMICSENYVTRRQSLKLLREILVERRNATIMKKYTQKRENLILMMIMLEDRSRVNQLEAFHVFKFFVANPKQSYSVKLVLWNNISRLIDYLKAFHADREDQQFKDEKNFVINLLAATERPVDRNREAAKGELSKQ